MQKYLSLNISNVNTSLRLNWFLPLPHLQNPKHIRPLEYEYDAPSGVILHISV